MQEAWKGVEKGECWRGNPGGGDFAECVVE